MPRPQRSLLSKKGALEYRHCDFVPDYWAELPEDKAPKGRVLLPKGARESMSDGGEVAIRTMSEAAKRDGVDIRTGHRVQRVIRNASGEVIGVEADTAKGKKRFFARKAVVFCTGGFTHNVELRKNYLSAPVYGGCAALSNEGDFVYIAGAVGAQLRNMNYAWMCPIVFEKAMARGSRADRNVFAVRRLDDLRQQGRPPRRQRKARLQRNGASLSSNGTERAAEYPNLLLIAIWDQRSQDHSAGDEYGRFIVPPGTDEAHVIKGATLAALSKAIGERLERYEAATGGLAARARVRKNAGGDDTAI